MKWTDTVDCMAIYVFFASSGGLFGNSMPTGFCEYAWQAIQNLACTLAGGGKVFGANFNIACCNDGIRPVIFRLEAVEE